MAQRIGFNEFMKVNRRLESAGHDLSTPRGVQAALDDVPEDVRWAWLTVWTAGRD